MNFSYEFCISNLSYVSVFVFELSHYELFVFIKAESKYNSNISSIDTRKNPNTNK